MTEPWTDLREQMKRQEEAALTAPEWPPAVDYPEFEKEPVEKPRPVLDNLLDVSSRMIFGGGSKTYKTWAMSDMALSIATGVEWWAFKALQAPCLYVNFELKKYYMQKRMRAIRLAKKLEVTPKQLHIWNLRGYEVTLETFKAELLNWIRILGVLVVFVDPFYKLLGGRDERISAEINLIMAAFDEINRLTGATIVFAAHFTKGNQAGKEAIDRISGGGSINRDPDNLVTLTKHETEHAFTVDFTLRDFPPIEPFVVRWAHPLLLRADELDPTKIKKPMTGRRQEFSPAELFNYIKEHDDELSTDAFRALCEERGWSKATFYRKFAILKAQRKVFESKLTGCWNIQPT